MKLTVVLAVLIGILVLACSSAAPAPVEPTPNIDATVEARLATLSPTYTFAPAPTPRLKPRVGVTKAMYLQIRDGMSYNQVVRIIGASGEEMSRNTIAGYTNVMYQWTNNDYSGMNAIFQNGRLFTKAQFGLR